VVSGVEQGIANDCCLVAALLEHRDFRLDVRGRSRGKARYDGSGDSDVLELLNLYELAREHDFDRASMRQLDFDRRTLQQIRKAHQQLLRATRAPRDRSAKTDREQAISMAVLSGYVDRLAQRAAGERRLHFANGKTAELSTDSVVHDANLLVAVSARERIGSGRKGKVVVDIASRVQPEWLLDLFVDRLEESEEFAFQPALGRVERCSRIRFGKLVLEESRSPASPSPEVARLLMQAAKSRGPASFDPEGRLSALECRLGVLRQAFPELGVPTALNVDELLLRTAEQVSSLGELEAQGLAGQALQELPPLVVQRLGRSVPEHVTLPNGRRLEVHYEPGKPPWIGSWLQDFFSVNQALTICDGRVPLSVHLWAPNRRAVQVTNDLGSFWGVHYPKLRQQLMRRYPKHAWPENGASATPPPPQARGRRQRSN
jgi:ATP-dependent helicase HrpB